jgi:DNA-directed RNA polymerase beta subunit
MNCKKIFTREFLSTNCTDVFITKKLKIHRENILLDRQKCLLPETQPYVVIAKERIKIDNEINKIYDEQAKLRRLIENKNVLIRELNNKRRNINYSESPSETKKFIRKCPIQDCRGFLSSRWKCEICENNICNKCNEQILDNHICDPSNIETMNLLNKDTKPCPKCGTMISKISGCFGRNTEILMWNGPVKLVQDILVGDILVGDDGNKRIVQDITTGIDELYEIQQSNGMNFVVNSKHTLLLKKENQLFKILAEDFLKMEDKNLYYGYKFNDSRSSIKIISKGIGEYFGFLLDDNHNFMLKDTTIQKNCDQMWCPDCHTAFSWNRGIIEKGQVHNPHFYEFQRRNNNGIIPRNPGDVPCGGLPDIYELRRVFHSYNLDNVTTINKLFLIHRIIVHIQHVELAFNDNDELINRNLRINFLMNKLSEKDFKQILQQNEKNKQKKNDFRNIYQMFVDVGSDIFRQIIINKSIINDQLIIFDNLIEYFNESLRKISKVYKCVCPGISKEYILENNLKKNP